MEIKGTDKVFIIDQNADTTPRKSALANKAERAVSVFDATFSLPLAKGFELSIPAIAAGESTTLTFNLGDVGNATSTVMTLYKAAMTVEEIENFKRGAAGGGAPQREPTVGSFSRSEVSAPLTYKYTNEANPLDDAVRITEDYTEARVGVQNKTNYEVGGALYPNGFSYADYNVGSLIGWYSYFATSRGFAGVDKKVLFQGAWLEQDGVNTNVKIVLTNIDAAPNTAATLKVAFYL